MFNMTVALIAKDQRAALEVFPGVPSLSLHGFHASGADQRSLEEWKNAVLHYSAMEGWTSVYFLETTHHCHLRRHGFEEPGLPGDANYAIFPVERGKQDEMRLL